MSVRRALLVAGACLTALALIVGTDLLYTLRHASKSSASAGKKQISTTERMRAVLVPPDQQPKGTSLQELDVKQAAAKHMFDVPTGFTFSPPSCIEYLEDAIGSPGAYSGWVQFGVGPNTRGEDSQFSAMAISVPGGVDLAKIEASAGACASGRMAMPSAKVRASVKLGHYAARTLPNARTLGLTITTAFDTGTSPAQRAAALGQCQIPDQPEPSMQLVSYSCATAAKKEMAKATTDYRFAGYLSYGNVLVEVCASTRAGAEEMIAVAYRRAQQALAGA